MASVHAHYRRGDWHATGLIGAGRSMLQLERAIDLGAAGTHVAHSRRELGQGVRAWRTRTRHGAGQRPANAIAGGDYDAVYSDAFNEHGDTGFQRVAQAGRNPQLPAAGGDVQQGLS